MKDAQGHGSSPRGGALGVADQHGVPTDHLQNAPPGATHHLMEGWGAKIGQDFFRPSADHPVQHIRDEGGGRAVVKFLSGKWQGYSGVVPKQGLRTL